jgi:hypothetical protein
MGYNFLYGVWKYSWDSDCDLFLKILEEEIKEDIYTQQIALQAQSIPRKLSFAPSVTQCCMMPSVYTAPSYGTQGLARSNANTKQSVYGPASSFNA